jgi:hypothetical protein
MTINEDRKALFAGELGYDGPISQLEYDWLVSKVGNDKGAKPDMWKAYLEGQGYSGSLSDMFASAPYPVGSGFLEWTPLALGSNLLAWWDASQGVTLSGSEVTAWEDRKGGSSVSQATSASRPLFSATGFNGAPCLTFDGTDDNLSAESVFSLPTGGTASRIWIVASQDALAADTTARTAFSYGGSSTDRRAILRQVISGVSRARAQAGNGTVITNADEVDVDLSSRHLIEATFTATTVACETDDSGPTTSASATVLTGTARTCIGSLPGATASNFWQGKIRDVIVTTDTLTTGEITKLQTFLLGRREL